MEYLGFVGERYTGVDIEHVGAGCHLVNRVGFHAAVVAIGQFGGQSPASGGVDPFTDDGERAIEADDDGLRCGTDDGLGHALALAFLCM